MGMVPWIYKGLVEGTGLIINEKYMKIDKFAVPNLKKLEVSYILLKVLIF